MTPDFLEAIEIAATRIPGPLVLPWPTPDNLGGLISFENFSEWRRFVLELKLRNAVPDTIAAKFDRAHKLLLLTWIDFDLIKAAELSALAALELALKDRYGEQTKEKFGNMTFGHLLRYLPKYAGLTDDKIPVNVRCRGGKAVHLLDGTGPMTLADIRNQLAHGYAFDAFPYAGLFELVRDLIDYAFEDFR